MSLLATNAVLRCRRTRRWRSGRPSYSPCSPTRSRVRSNTTRSHESDYYMRGKPLLRSLCDVHLLVLCI